MAIRVRTIVMLAALTAGALAAQLRSASADGASTENPADDSPTTDSMAPLYGNVVSVHNEQTNSDSAFFFQSNRTFVVVVNREGKTLRIGGLWAANLDNTKTCLMPSPLGGVTVPEMVGCLTLSGHALGDHWTAVNDADQTIDITVSAPQEFAAPPPG